MFVALLSSLSIALAQPRPALLAAEELLEPAPKPLASPMEHGRRWFELGPELGVGVPHCQRDGGAGCPSLTAGVEVGIVGLVRPTSAFAFGVEGRRLTFSIESSDGAGTTNASVLFGGILGRLYVVETETLDLYLDLALGAGSLALSSSERGRSLRENVNFSLAARSSAGLDVLTNSWLRFGGFLSFMRYFPASVHHCENTLCAGTSARAAWLPVGATTLGVRIAVATGDLL